MYERIFLDDDEHKETVHAGVENIYIKMVVEDCSTSWLSGDENDRSTTSSLDKDDGDGSSSSGPNGCSIPSTLDDVVTTRPSSLPH
jgi:hypothetical protein